MNSEIEYDFIFEKSWKWVKNFKYESPCYPFSHADRINSEKDHSKNLYYVLDREYNIWIGIEKKDSIDLEYFDLPLGLEIIYNFNTLKYLEIINLIPKKLLVTF